MLATKHTLLCMFSMFGAYIVSGRPVRPPVRCCSKEFPLELSRDPNVIILASYKDLSNIWIQPQWNEILVILRLSVKYHFSQINASTSYPLSSFLVIQYCTPSSVLMTCLLHTDSVKCQNRISSTLSMIRLLHTEYPPPYCYPSPYCM